MAIPKIIHQVWEGRTEPCMPTRLQILARTWREQNPDWEYHLWNGEEMDELVEKHFPEYLSMYRSFPYNVQRWDTIRYMICIWGSLYGFGYGMLQANRTIIKRRDDRIWRRAPGA